MIKCNIGIRLPKEEKQYYEHRLKLFCNLFDSDKIKAIQFGKQDIRGTESITLIDNRNCVPMQKHFYNKWEMLGFICGFVSIKQDPDFKSFMNKEGGLNE